MRNRKKHIHRTSSKWFSVCVRYTALTQAHSAQDSMLSVLHKYKWRMLVRGGFGVLSVRLARFRHFSSLQCEFVSSVSDNILISAV